MPCCIANSPKATHFPLHVLPVKHGRGDCRVSTLELITRALAGEVVERWMRELAPGADKGFYAEPHSLEQIPIERPAARGSWPAFSSNRIPTWAREEWSAPGKVRALCREPVPA
jgi:hypothetical protein